MRHEISVDIMLTDNVNGLVVDTITRPLRELPDGNFGVKYRRKIYRLHALDGNSGHIHLRDTQTYAPDQCPVFARDFELAAKPVVRAAVDFSGRYKYLLFNIEEETLRTILNDLEQKGVEIEKFGPSTRPAANGIAYDHWARVINWDGTGNDLAALVLDVAGSVDEYSITFDDVIERTISSLKVAAPEPVPLLTIESRSGERDLNGIDSIEECWAKFRHESPSMVFSTVAKFFGLETEPAMSAEDLSHSVGSSGTRETLLQLCDGISALNARVDCLLSERLGTHATGISSDLLPEEFARLKEREQFILVHRYGLIGQRKQTLERIGADLGISRTRVGEIEKKALGRLPLTIAEQITGKGSRAGNPNRIANAISRHVAGLSKRAGQDLHQVSDIVAAVATDAENWEFGPKLINDLARFDVHRLTVDELNRMGVIWLDGDHETFLNSKSDHPFVNIAGKFIRLHGKVNDEVLHDAVAHVWTRRKDRKSVNLDVEDVGLLLEHYGFEVRDHWVFRGNFSLESRNGTQISEGEQPLVDALVDRGGFATLEELRAIVPGMTGGGTGTKQILMGASPLFERLGPSLYGLRGFSYDPEILATAQRKANSGSHGWINRASWESQIVDSKMSYRVSSRRDPQDNIGVSDSTASWLSSDWDGLRTEVICQTQSGFEVLLTLVRRGDSVRLYGLHDLWRDLSVQRGQTVVFEKDERRITSYVASSSGDSTSIEIDLGRGWVSHKR